MIFTLFRILYPDNTNLYILQKYNFLFRMLAILWLALFVSSNLYFANYPYFDKIESSYLYDCCDQESDQEENEETEDHQVGFKVLPVFASSKACLFNIYHLATFSRLEHFEIITPPPDNGLIGWV